MGRPKEFDPEQVLDVAMNLFWDKGYRATSMADVVRCAGIGRASLYNTFGDKHALFLVAVERYQRNVHMDLIEMISDSGSPRAAIERAIEKVAEDALGARGNRGCLLTKSALELAAHDEKVRERVSESFDWLESAFESAVVRAQRKGEIRSDREARKIARFLVSSVQGLGVIGRTDPDPKQVADIVEMVLAVLG